MLQNSLTILGGGNTAFAVAASFALRGAEVTMCEIPGFEHAIEPIQSSRRIQLSGVAETGQAQLAQVTCDFASALEASHLLLVIIPSYGHRAFAQAMAPYIREYHTVVLLPGNLGSLQLAKILRDHGAPQGVTVAEVDTAPFVCRKMSPTSAHIWGVVSGLGLGVFPARRGARVQNELEHWFPGIHLYPNVVACGLAAMNPVVHPAGVLMNSGRIEYSRGDFYFYEEGVTPSVCRLIYAIDEERRAVAKAAADVDLAPVDDAFHTAGFGPRGDLWAAINGSRMLTQLRAPGSMDTRWLTEDAPYGLATWSLLGEQFDINCRMMRSTVDLTGAALDCNFWSETRTPEDLGIAQMSAAELRRFVQDGKL